MQLWCPCTHLLSELEGSDLLLLQKQEEGEEEDEEEEEEEEEEGIGKEI